MRVIVWIAALFGWRPRPFVVRLAKLLADPKEPWRQGVIGRIIENGKISLWVYDRFSMGVWDWKGGGITDPFTGMEKLYLWPLIQARRHDPGTIPAYLQDPVEDLIRDSTEP